MSNFLKVTRNILVPISILALSACATIQPQAGFGDVQAEVTARTGEQIRWRTGSPADHQVTAELKALLVRPLEIEHVTQIALLNNAGLQAMYENLGIAQASLVQAGLLKNPVFDGALRFVGGGIAPSLDIDVSQDFLQIFTLPLRKKMARFEFETAKLTLTGDVVDFVGTVRQAYYSAQASEQAAELMLEVTEGTAALLLASETLFEAGNINELMLNRQQAVHEEALLMLGDAETSQMRDHEQLTQLMGLWGEDTDWDISRRLPTLPRAVIATEGVEQRVLDKSIVLAITRSKIERLTTQLGLEKATSLIPDLEIGYSGERGGEGFENGLGIGFQIPIFDTGKARRFAVASELRAAQWHYVQQAVEIRAASRNSAMELKQARNKVDRLFNRLLPLRQAIMDGVQLDYNAMQVGVFSVLMDQRRQIETGQYYIAALKAYWMARANIELLLSGSMMGSTLMASEGAEMSGMMNNEEGGH